MKLLINDWLSSVLFFRKSPNNNNDDVDGTIGKSLFAVGRFFTHLRLDVRQDLPSSSDIHSQLGWNLQR